MAPTIRPIKTEEDYEAVLERIDALMDAEAGSDEADELEVLATLVELYEDKHYPMDFPDPIEALKFRMEQANLSRRDLIPLLGSYSKVSEVLSGKRSLTLQMIRALHEHLGIPADVLLKQPGASIPETPDNMDFSKFPLKEMAKRGWISSDRGLKDHAEELIRGLIERAGGLKNLPQIFYRENSTVRSNAKVDLYALKAWCYQSIALARETELPGQYVEGSITDEFARSLVKLSWSENGPKLAQEYLANRGIHLVYLPHLPQTYLDGAAFRLPDNTPVIGLTLRYDRLDNFWFCLFHELAHLALHLKDGTFGVLTDDLSLRDLESTTDFVGKEKEADDWARNTLIPQSVWEESNILDSPVSSTVTALARHLDIHPAIIAGRIRREKNNYHLLTRLVRNGQVRSQFQTN